MPLTTNDLFWAGVGLAVNTTPPLIIILFPFRHQLKIKGVFVAAVCALLIMVCAIGFGLLPTDYQAFSFFQIWMLAFVFPDLIFVLPIIKEKKSKLLYLFVNILGLIVAIIKSANFITLTIFDNPGFFHFAIVYTVIHAITTPLMVIYINRLAKRTIPIVDSSGDRLWKIIWIVPAMFLLINLLYNPGFDPAVVTQTSFMVTNLLSAGGIILSSIILIFTLQIVSETADIKIEGERQKQLLANAEKDKADLERVNHLKTDLMRTISHEMRTPLAVMMGFAQLNAEKIRGKGLDENTANHLDTIAGEARRLNIMIEELSSPIYVEASSKDRREVSAQTVIRKVAGLYQVVLERKNIDLRLNLPEDLPFIYGDEYELTQIMFNLLRNADKHTDNGTITISAKAADNEVTITVADTGTGIPPELLPHVLEHGTSGEKGGMGFGLAICKDIVEAYNKRIWVESPGKGTIVSFTMPIYNSEHTGGGTHDG